MANERIFISYKRVNKEPVFAFIDRIERELGVKCWVDLDGIETSAQFASKICTAIDRAEHAFAFANGKAEAKGKVGLLKKDAWHKIDKTGKVID